MRQLRQSPRELNALQTGALHTHQVDASLHVIPIARFSMILWACDTLTPAMIVSRSAAHVVWWGSAGLLCCYEVVSAAN